MLKWRRGDGLKSGGEEVRISQNAQRRVKKMVLRTANQVALVALIVVMKTPTSLLGVLHRNPGELLKVSGSKILACS